MVAQHECGWAWMMLKNQAIYDWHDGVGPMKSVSESLLIIQQTLTFPYAFT